MDTGGSFKRVIDSFPGTDHDDIQQVKVLNSNLYFSALTALGVRKLFSFDGTNLEKVMDSSGAVGSDDGIRDYTYYNGKLYVVAKNSSGFYKLFEYNPTGSVLTQISDINPGADDFNLSNPVEDWGPNFTELSSKLYFMAGNTAKHLYSFDGATLKIVANTFGDTATSDLSQFNPHIHNNKLYYVSKDGSGFDKTFRYDPDSDKSETPFDTRVGNHDYPGEYLTIGDNLIFYSNDSAGKKKVYYFNEMENKIFQISNTYPGQFDSTSDIQVTNYGGRAYMVLRDSAGFTKLYVYDFEAKKLVQLTNFQAGAHDNPKIWGVFDNKLFFASLNAFGGKKLFALCDGTQGCSI